RSRARVSAPSSAPGRVTSKMVLHAGQLSGKASRSVATCSGRRHEGHWMTVPMALTPAAARSLLVLLLGRGLARGGGGGARGGGGRGAHAGRGNAGVRAAVGPGGGNDEVKKKKISDRAQKDQGGDKGADRAADHPRLRHTFAFRVHAFFVAHFAQVA